jgi:glycosyltransferase involved in cell wall biosynthesis
MKRGISVIICCYNSSSRIENTLNYLLLQQFETPLNWEIVIVDNNSSDNTTEIVNNYLLSNNFTNYTIVNEINQGLSYARKKGADIAKYDIVVYCDDDNWLQHEYLENVNSILMSQKECGVLGGWSKAAYESNCDVPAWFDEIAGSMAIGGYPGEKDLEVDFVWGAGMAIKKELILDFFNKPFKLTDRKGSMLASGGDSEICLFAKQCNYKILKSSKLFFTHFVPENRLLWSYIRRLHEGFGYSSMEKYFTETKSKFKVYPSYVRYTAKIISKNPASLINVLLKKENNVKLLKVYGILGAWKYLLEKQNLKQILSFKIH